MLDGDDSDDGNDDGDDGNDDGDDDCGHALIPLSQYP
jgi:hypothetical protein